MLILSEETVTRFRACISAEQLDSFLYSEWSYGFRPNRNCEMAIRKLLVYLNEGYEWIVDIDLERFFDNVPRDKLMSLVHDSINDGDTESLICK